PSNHRPFLRRRTLFLRRQSIDHRLILISNPNRPSNRPPPRNSVLHLSQSHPKPLLKSQTPLSTPPPLSLPLPLPLPLPSNHRPPLTLTSQGSVLTVRDSVPTAH